MLWMWLTPGASNTALALKKHLQNGGVDFSHKLIHQRSQQNDKTSE